MRNMGIPTSLRQSLARPEVRLLLALLGVAGGTLAVLWLGGEALEGDTRAFDRTILLSMRVPGNPADPIGPGWVERMAQDLTSLGSITDLTVVTLLVIGFLVVARARGAAVLLAASVGGGMLVSSALKMMFERPRPDLVPHLAQVVTASFPSGHAMLSAVTYLTLGALLTRLQLGRRAKRYVMAAAVGLTLVIGISRVYLGVHWPTDVLAGWCMGAAWALLCWAIARWLQRRGSVEPPGNAEAE
ncbi:phosphatase PAP2 family protein [Azospirillum sp. CT11-132]|uniref:phosphatase PAP2 family protein n=1 Tax=Azospirillum sp. CT11-132 TaxID=3396317 RepID=UPI0039A6938F